MAQTPTRGPLSGIKIIELAGIGPCPFAAMMLADAGAQVIRLERAAPGAPERAADSEGSYWDILNRSRVSVGIDLKNPEAIELVLRLVEGADGLVEGFRPGVAERLGVGPDACLARNPALVYGRMTGWGQDGPLAARAGHDIDYIAIGGALWPVGRADSPPVPPLNLVGDFGGGGMLLAFGMVSALLEATRSGQGQVVDAAMVDGAATLMTMIHAFHASGIWNDERGANMLDTGAPFYEVYETADAKFLALGGIEPQFYAELLEGLGLAGDPLFAAQNDKANWPTMKERVAAVVATKTATNGTLSLPAPTPAWRRCSPRGRPTSIRTIRPGRPSSKSMASCSRRPRPGSAARPPPSAVRRRFREATPSRDCSSGALRRGPWPNCGRRAP